MQAAENDYTATWEEPEFSDNSGEIALPRTYMRQWKARELHLFALAPLEFEIC